MKKWTASTYVITDFNKVKRILDFDLEQVIVTLFYLETKSLDAESSKSAVST